MTVENLFAVILGDKKAVKGGSGKVVDSKPNDRIFIYYSDHGGPGVLGELLVILPFEDLLLSLMCFPLQGCQIRLFSLPKISSTL